MSRTRLLQALLAFVCLSHLFFGLIAFIGPAGPVRAVAARLYDADLQLTPQLQHVVRILGAFMIAIGVLAGLAALYPQRSGPVVIGVAVLLVLRVLQRAIFAGEVRDAFGVSTAHLWVQSLFFLALAAALGALAWRATPPVNTTAAPAGAA